MKPSLLKTSLIIITACLLSTAATSQGAYINVNAGYGFRMSSNYISSFSFHNVIETSNSRFAEQVFVSFGQGFTGGGSFGYMFNKNIGAEISASYLFGNIYNAEKFENDRIIDMTLSAKMLRINPVLVLHAGFEKIDPYAKFGMIAGFGKIWYEENRIYHDNGDDLFTKKKLSGGIPVGLSSSLGINYRLSDRLSFFIEMNMVNLSYSPLKGEVIEYIKKGEDALSDLTTFYRETEYVDSYKDTGMDGNEPDKQIKQTFPFGSFGPCFGLLIRL